MSSKRTKAPSVGHKSESITNHHGLSPILTASTEGDFCNINVNSIRSDRGCSNRSIDGSGSRKSPICSANSENHPKNMGYRRHRPDIGRPSGNYYYRELHVPEAVKWSTLLSTNYYLQKDPQKATDLDFTPFTKSLITEDVDDEAPRGLKENTSSDAFEDEEKKDKPTIRKSKHPAPHHIPTGIAYPLPEAPIPRNFIDKHTKAKNDWEHPLKYDLRFCFTPKLLKPHLECPQLIGPIDSNNDVMKRCDDLLRNSAGGRRNKRTTDSEKAANQNLF